MMATGYLQLNTQQKEAILLAFQGGAECRVIPGILGVSGRSVARVLAEFGVNTKRRNRYILNENYFDGDGCAYPNKDRSGGLVCVVGSRNFAEELSKLMGMGSTIAHSHNVVYYWRIFSRINIQIFHDLMYQYPNLGLARKKEKIEQILGSYHRG